MLRGRQAVILSYVNFHKLVPVIVSIVVAGVIVLLLAADKPLEESGLRWILSGGRQTGSAGSTRRPGEFVFFVAAVFPLCLCANEMTQRVKRRQKQQTETDINTSVSSSAHAARWTLLSAAGHSAERTCTLSLDGPSGAETTDCGGDARPVELHRTSVSVSLLSEAPSNTLLTVCSPVFSSFNTGS